MTHRPPVPSFSTRRLLRAAAWVIPLGVLLNVGVALLTVDFHIVRKIGALSFAALVAGCGLALVPWVTQSFRIGIWTRFVGHPIRFLSGLRIAAGGVLGSAVTPTAVGGGTIRWALATRYGLPSGKAASLLAVEAVEDLAFFAIALPLALLLSSADEGEALRRAATSPARRLDDPMLVALGLGLLAGLGVALAVRAGLRGRLGAGARRRLLRLVARLRRPFRQTLGDARVVLVQVVRRGKGWFALSLSLTAVQWIARYSVATVVIAVLGGPLRPYLFWVLGWMTYAVSSAVPTPGAAGAAEATFYVLHAPFVDARMLVVATAVWRLLMFYLPALAAVAVFPALSALESRRAVPLDPTAPPPPPSSEAPSSLDLGTPTALNAMRAGLLPILLALALLAVALLTVAGCDSATEGPSGANDWQVLLRNANAAQVYVLSAGETPSAATLLAPGAMRTVTVAPGVREDTRPFRAGFDGTTFDLIDCIILNARATGSVVEVTSAGGIVCLNW